MLRHVFIFGTKKAVPPVTTQEALYTLSHSCKSEDCYTAFARHI